MTKNDSPFTDQHSREDEFVHTIKRDLTSIKNAIDAIHVPAGLPDANIHVQGMIRILTELSRDLSHRFHGTVTALYKKRENQEKRRERIGSSRIILNTDYYTPIEDDVNPTMDEDSRIMVMIPTVRTTHPSPTPQVRLLMERASEIRDIEANVAEVGQMYRQLSEMVAVQNEHIRRIDENLVMADMHANEAHRQLTHYLSKVRSNRWLIAKMFGVLLIFIVFFLVFFI